MAAEVGPAAVLKGGRRFLVGYLRTRAGVLGGNRGRLVDGGCGWTMTDCNPRLTVSSSP